MIVYKNNSIFCEMNKTKKMLNITLDLYRELIVSGDIDKSESLLSLIEYQQQRFSYQYSRYLDKDDNNKRDLRTVKRNRC